MWSRLAGGTPLVAVEWRRLAWHLRQRHRGSGRGSDVQRLPNWSSDLLVGSIGS